MFAHQSAGFAQGHTTRSLPILQLRITQLSLRHGEHAGDFQDLARFAGAVGSDSPGHRLQQPERGFGQGGRSPSHGSGMAVTMVLPDPHHAKTTYSMGRHPQPHGLRNRGVLGLYPLLFLRG